MLRVAESAEWPGAETWDALVQSDPEATPFQTRDWLTAWWRHFGGRKQPLILQAFQGSDLVGLLFLTRHLGAWPVVRSMGVGPSDYLAPLAQPSLRAQVMDSFLDHLSRLPCLVDLHQLPLDSPPNDAIAQSTCLVVDLPSTYEGFLAGIGKSLRYDAKRFDRDPELKVREDMDVAPALGILFDQHEKRWRSRGLPGAFLGKMRRFHEEWAPKAQAAGMLRLGVLEKAGTPIGSIYAFTMGGTCYYYQAGFDPGASALSPGTLLVAHTLKRAIEESATRFDFCRGDEPYKRRWKPDHVRTNYRVLMAGSGLGRVGEGWNRLAWRVEERIRQRLEGGRLLPKRRQEGKSEQA